MSLRKILLVDDENFNIRALKVILKSFTGIDPEEVCDVARNGIHCLELIEKDIQLNEKRCCSYKIIFMDCNMPHMDGYEATQKLRQMLYENNIEQPIVSACTGHTDQSYIDRAIQSGMNQVLEKPVKSDLVKKLISTYFN